MESYKKAEKIEEHKGNSDTNCSWWLWNIPEKPGKKTDGTGD